MPPIDWVSLVALPAGLAAVLVLPGWQPWRSAAPRPRGRPASLLALALGYLAAQVATQGLDPFPPREAWLQLGLLVAAVSGLALLERGTARGHALPWAARALLVGAYLWIALEPKRLHRWEAGETALWLGGLLVAWLALLAGASMQTARARGPRVPIAWGLAGFAASVGLGLSGSVKLAEMLGAELSALGVLCALALWRRELALLAGASAPLALVLGGLLIAGTQFSELPLGAALLFAAAPFAASLPLWSASSARGIALRLLMVAATGAAGIWLSIGEPDHGDYY